MKPSIEIREHCMACGACVEVCPVLCLQFNGEDVVVVQEEACFGCRQCEEVCPEEAILIRGVVP